jgi:outer membrane protein OmpA-like peptidoglycan-associated protein
MKKNILLIFLILVSYSCSTTLSLNDFNHIREVVNRNDVKSYQPKYYDNGGDTKTNFLNKKSIAVEKEIIVELIRKEKINLSKLSKVNNDGATTNTVKNEILEINRQIENLENRLNNISNDDVNAHQKILNILVEMNDLKCKLIDGTNQLLIKTNKIFGDISFNTGKSNLTKRGKSELDDIVTSIENDIYEWKRYLNSCNERIFENEVFIVVIDIDGYADAIGSTNANLNLSKERALEVKKQLEIRFYNLIEQKRLNIIFNKINAKGYGEKLPPGIYASKSNDPERRVCYVYSVVGPSKLLN